MAKSVNMTGFELNFTELKIRYFTFYLIIIAS